MFYVYILKSTRDQTYYYGSSKNLGERLKVHNSGKVNYTKGHLPYKLHYSEEFESRKDAIHRKRFFKSMEGHRWLKSKKII